MGTFITGMIGGTGAQIDKDGRGEMTSLILREFLEVPELRFNKIDVVNAELSRQFSIETLKDVSLYTIRNANMSKLSEFYKDKKVLLEQISKNTVQVVTK